MTPIKNFLHTEPYLPSLSKGRMIIGILLGSLFALAFYCFFSMLGEMCRILLFRGEEDPFLILPDAIVWRQHLFLAFLSLILGQSVCFLHWFNRPIGNIRWGRIRNKVHQSVNDQRYLNCIFLSWFTRLAYVLFVVVGGLQLYVAYEPEAFGQYDYLLFLIVIVLFLQTWLTLRRIFRRSLQWMMFSAGVLTTLALALSFFNPVNYQAINEIARKRDIWSAYEIKLPESEYWNDMETNTWRRATMLLVRERESVPGSSPLLFTKLHLRGEPWGEWRTFQPVDPDTLFTVVEKWEAKGLESWQGAKGIYAIYIDRDICMKEVDHLKRQLTGAGVKRITYGVVPANRIYRVGRK